jgi:curved DNA-binding protein CbpA
LSVHSVTRDTPELVPEPVPEPPRCLTYREMTHLSFYELLQCNVTAHARTLIRQYGRLARIYHPDKGGEPMSFRYLKMAYDVLKDPETRAEYDRDGKGRWTATFQTDEPPPLVRMVVPSPRSRHCARCGERSRTTSGSSTCTATSMPC